MDNTAEILEDLEAADAALAPWLARQDAMAARAHQRQQEQEALGFLAKAQTIVAAGGAVEHQDVVLDLLDLAADVLGDMDEDIVALRNRVDVA